MSTFQSKDRGGHEYEFVWRHVRQRERNFGTKKEARDAEAERRTELRAGADPTRGRRSAIGADPVVVTTGSPRFTDWAGIYLAHQRTLLEDKGVPEKKIVKLLASREKKLRVILRFWGARPKDDDTRMNRNTETKDLRPYHNLSLLDPIVHPKWIMEFEAHLRARGLAGQTKNNNRSTVSNLYELALDPEFRERSKVASNPFHHLRRDTSRRRKRVASFDELNRVLAQSAPHLRLAIEIGMYAYELRVGSILALTWNDIDPNFERITVGDHKTIGDSDEAQVVPIVLPLRKVLKAAHAARNPRCNRVVQYNGLGIDKCITAITAACERAGVEYGVKHGITFHTLRHTLNTEAARLGFSKETVQLMGGWKTTAMAAHYVHQSGNEKRKPLERIAKHVQKMLREAQLATTSQ